VNFQLIGELVRLRYKLMWAKTRTRNGKIALFFAGYLLLIMFLVIMGAGGFGAGVVAVKSGKATMIASAVLGGLFVQALLATVILGFGVNEVFADTELRRYPLRVREREMARHLLGAADPFWILILVLDFGLMTGLYLFDAGSFWLGLVAVLLLLVCNYFCARVLSLLVERLVRKKGGSTAILALVVLLGFLPGLLSTGGKISRPAVQGWLRAFSYTPPAGAALAMTHVDSYALSGLAIVVWWLVGLMAVLVALEQRPVQSKSAQQTKVSWDSPFERIGALFGAKNAVLVGQWLRFYSRNNRFRTIYPLAVPIIGGLVLIYSKQGAFGHDEATKVFVGALGGFACVGFIGTAQFAVNQFGYVGSGFRRYMLLPTDPAATLRAGSYAFLLLSGALVPVAALAWAIFSPVKTDARMMAMLLSSSVMGMFVMNGIGVWVAILAPRRGNYYASFGNDLSFLANVVVIGGMFLLLFLPRLLSKLWAPAVTPANWWGVVLLAGAAAVFYRYSLSAASAAFRARRERLLAVMEGRS
jgi:hypothetical protein